MMRRNPLAVCTLAATLAVGSLAFGQAAERDRSDRGVGSDQSSGAGSAGGSASGTVTGSAGTSGASGQSDMRGSMNAGMGQADTAINQQLQQIAAEPRTAPDKLFVLHSAMGNQFEIAFAQIAQERAQNDQVKQLARQIMDDHRQALQQLQQSAQGMNLTLPQSLPMMKQQELAIYRALPADVLEKKFVAHMQAAHAKDIVEYRNASQMAMDPGVKQYAQQTLPKLQQHASHVNQAAIAMGLPSSDMGNTTNDARPAGARMEGSGRERPAGGGDTTGTTGGSTGGTSGTGGSSGGSTSGSGRTGDQYDVRFHPLGMN